MNWYKQAQFGSIRQRLIDIRNAIASGVGTTKEMMQIYNKWIRGKATSQEVEIANKQARDLLKGSALASLLIIPGGSLLIFVLIKFARKFGIELVPSYFKEERANDELV